MVSISFFKNHNRAVTSGYDFKKAIIHRKLLLNSIFSTFYYRPQTIGSVATDSTKAIRLNMDKIILYSNK